MVCQVFVRRRPASVSDGDLLHILRELRGVVRKAVGAPADIAVFDIGQFDRPLHDLQVIAFVPSNLMRIRTPDAVATQIANVLEKAAPVHNRIAVQVFVAEGAFVAVLASCPT